MSAARSSSSRTISAWSPSSATASPSCMRARWSSAARCARSSTTRAIPIREAARMRSGPHRRADARRCRPSLAICRTSCMLPGGCIFQARCRSSRSSAASSSGRAAHVLAPAHLRRLPLRRAASRRMSALLEVERPRRPLPRRQPAAARLFGRPVVGRGGRRRLLRARCRRDLCAGRRIRLRQDDARARHCRARAGVMRGGVAF